MNTIKDNVKEILRDKFRFSDALLDEIHWDEPLTGRRFSFSGTDLAYLLFEVEGLFDIRIDSRFFDQYGFSSLTKIIQIIEQSAKKIV